MLSNESNEFVQNQLQGAVDLLSDKYDQSTPAEIATAEGITLRLESITETYKWDGDNTLVLCSQLNDEERVRWMIGALAARMVTTNATLLIKPGLN
jgi:hypothetical protein